jgi:hypothetical protein
MLHVRSVWTRSRSFGLFGSELSITRGSTSPGTVAAWASRYGIIFGRIVASQLIVLSMGWAAILMLAS